jgi:glucodextranase-like protein/PASTA domain-containing protein
VPRALPVLLAVLALAGCGSDEPPPADPPAVRLTIEAPADTSTVKDSTVEVRGRVQPTRAAVEVGGKAAPVSSGAFSKTVKLEQGVNVIDVSASMRGRSSAFAALRVTYDPRVRIPDLTGKVDEDAAAELDKLGLEVQLDAVGGLFDELRSGPRRVCESDPPRGTEVDPGSNVTLKTAKTC